MAKIYFKSILGFLSLVFLPLTLFADIQVQSTVDRNQLGEEDTLVLKVSVISSDSVEMTEPRVPDLEGFDLINSWSSRSTSTQLVQGPRGMEFESTNRTDFNYMLAPKKTGEVDIGSFEVVVEGKSYRTKSITVTVLEGSSPSGNIAEQDEDEDIFSQLLKRGGLNNKGYTSAPADPNHAFFIQVELDKTEVFEGEQVTANWYIYTRGVIEQLDRLKFPNLKGFWKEDIEVAPTLNFSQEIVNGIPYKKAMLASYALFPINAGKAVVDEYKIKSVIRLPAQGFGNFGFGRPYTYTRSSENVKIEVKPLPTDGQPKDFSGAVGNFSVNGQIEGDHFKANQPFSFKVRFEGQGNAKLIDLPQLELPPSLELYDIKKDAKFYKTGQSYKEFELLLIPREAGELKIPALSVSIFDPVDKVYVQKSTQPLTIQVEAGGSGDSITPSRLAKNDIEQKTPKALTLPEPIVDWNQVSSGTRIPLVPSFAFAFMAVIGLLGFKAKKEFEWGARKSNLRHDIKSRFKKVYSLIDKDQWRPASVEVTNVIYYTFGAVVGSGGAHLEMEKLIKEAPSSLRRALEPELSERVEQFQALSFAPEAVLGDLKSKDKLRKEAQQMEKLLLKAANLIEDDDELKKS